jgi:hypothetical protein
MLARLDRKMRAFAAGIGLVFGALLRVDPAQAEAPRPAVTALAPRPSPIPLDLGLRVGASVRIGDAPNFPVKDRVGSTIGLSIFAAPTPRFSLGLVYEHTGLGSERGGERELSRVDVSRSLDALIAGLRLHLWSDESLRVSALIGPGLAWQSASAAGLVSSGASVVGVRCAATSGPDLVLRAGLGAEVALGSGVWLLADATLDNARLGNGAVGECILGAGTATLFAGRVGFAYRFDDVGRYFR